jgi:hypothetical protein
VDASVGVDQDVLACQPLRAVAGDGIAVVAVAVLDSVEFDLAAVVEPGRGPAIWRD